MNGKQFPLNPAQPIVKPRQTHFGCEDSASPDPHKSYFWAVKRIDEFIERMGLLNEKLASTSSRHVEVGSGWSVSL